MTLYMFHKTKREIMSCSIITITFISIGAILLYILSYLWDIDIIPETTFLLIGGMLSLCLGEICAQKIYRKPRTYHIVNYKYYHIKYTNILISTYVVATLLYVLEIKKLGASLGYNDLNAIGEVKANIEELSNQMNPIIRQMYKVVTSASYIHALIFANNIFFAKATWIKELKHMIPFLCTIIITVASGGRLNIYKCMIGILFIIYMIMRENSKWEKLYISQLIKIGLPVMIGFILLFNSLSLIVKNNAEDRTKRALLEYVSYYAGSPILVFNIRVEDGRNQWAYERFGNYTFSGVYKILGFPEDKKADIIGSGLVPLGGDSDYAGNAQTIFGGTYLDFGAWGMFIFMFISYFLFAKYYYKNILNTYSSYKRNKKLIIYTYLYTSIMSLAFYDSCYWILLSTTGILTLIILILMYILYFKKLLVIQ